MTPDDHIDRADQYVTRMPNASLAQAHAMIAIAKLLRARLTPARSSIAGDCGTADDWAALKIDREAAGIRLADIAPHVGVSVPYLSQLERGLRNDSRGWFGLASAVVAEWEVISDDG